MGHIPIMDLHACSLQEWWQKRCAQGVSMSSQYKISFIHIVDFNNDCKSPPHVHKPHDSFLAIVSLLRRPYIAKSVFKWSSPP